MAPDDMTQDGELMQLESGSACGLSDFGFRRDGPFDNSEAIAAALAAVDAGWLVLARHDKLTALPPDREVECLNGVMFRIKGNRDDLASRAAGGDK